MIVGATDSTSMHEHDYQTFPMITQVPILGFEIRANRLIAIDVRYERF